MSADTRASLGKIDLEIKQLTSFNKKAELEMVEHLLNRYLAAFRVFHERNTGKIQRSEFALLVLLVRGFNSLRCAFDLLQKGYYSQAGILIRAADEDYLTGRHCEISQKTVEALLVGEFTVPKFRKMAKDISPEFCDNWDINYGVLSEIAHPRQLAIALTANRKDNTFNFGANYIEDQFNSICYALVRVAVSMTEFPLKLLGKDAPQWEKESQLDFRKAYAYLEHMGVQANCSYNGI